MKSNAVTRNILLLLFLMQIVVYPAMHNYQDLIQTEILSSILIFENLHHQDPAANRENQFQMYDFSNDSLFGMPHQASSFLQQVPFDSIPSLTSIQHVTLLRC